MSEKFNDNLASTNESVEVKSWDELAKSQQSMDKDLDECLKTTIQSCWDDAEKGWDGHLNEVYKRMHQDLHSKSDVDKLLTDSESKFAGFRAMDEKLARAIITDSTSRRDSYPAYSVAKDRAVELTGIASKSNAELADEVKNCDSYDGKNSCLLDVLEDKEADLNIAERHLRERLGLDERDLLYDTQKAWWKYYDAEKLFIDEMHPRVDEAVSERAITEQIKVIADRKQQIHYYFVNQQWPSWR